MSEDTWGQECLYFAAKKFSSPIMYIALLALGIGLCELRVTFLPKARVKVMAFDESMGQIIRVRIFGREGLD